MKILLITPPYHSGIVESAGKWPPLHLVYLAGELEKNGHAVEIYDAMSKDHTLAQIKQRLKRVDYEVVGIGAYTPTIESCLSVLRIAKTISDKTITVLGGVHTTFCHDYLLKTHSDIVDFSVIGEGEKTFAELVNSLEKAISPNGIAGLAFFRDGKIESGPERKFIEDLDTLTPAWHLLDWNDYPFFVLPEGKLAVISTSRGCVHKCTFCSQSMLWHSTWRSRKPQNVAKEMETLNRKYGRNTFLIADEYPTYDSARWEKLLDLIIESGLNINILMETRAEDIIRDKEILHKYKQAGVIHMFIGVETEDQQTLDNIKKDMTFEEAKESIDLLNQAGIASETSFIVGLPEDDEYSVKSKLEKAKELAPDFAHFLNIMPWPYTEMSKQLESSIEDKDLSHYNYINPIVRTKHLSRDELSDLILECYKEFYMWQFPRWAKLADINKRKYVLSGAKEMMGRSALKNMMARDNNGERPELMINNLKALGLC